MDKKLNQRIIESIEVKIGLIKESEYFEDLTISDFAELDKAVDTVKDRLSGHRLLRG